MQTAKLGKQNCRAVLRLDVSSKTSAEYGAVTRDVDGNKELDTNLAGSSVKFDYYASSIGLDLKAVRKVTKIELTGKSRRINKNSVEVYASTDGTEGHWTKAEGITFVPSKDGTTLLFAEPIEAQYLKVHSICDERDEEYEPVDKATVSGTPAQLVEVYYTADGEDITWTFDARGNRLTEQKYAGGVSEGKTALEYYDYSDLIKSRGTWRFNYDKNGNMTSRGTDGTWNGSSYTWASDRGELWEYGYDLSNRLISVKKSSAGTKGLKEIAVYVYDIRGLRVESIKTGSADEDGSSATDSGTMTSATTTYYQYGLNGELLWSDDGTTQEKYIYAHATIWAEVRTTGGESATYYHHTDHTGTTECITDAKGTVVWEASYEAYGKLVHENGTVSFKASFTGKQIDEDTGLYYFNARWYDAELGRFVSEDPARDGTNWYEYCRNNPLIYLDPSGLSTTRDDYAYQLRTTGHPEEAAAMESAAAQANNGYTQSSGPGSSNTSSQQKSEPEENHSPSEAELSTHRGTEFTIAVPVYSTLFNDINFDLGRDYSNLAVTNFQNGHPVLAGVQMLDAAAEAIIDIAAAYGAAAFIGWVAPALLKTSGVAEVGAVASRPSSKILGANLEAAGFSRPANSAAHHIVAGRAPAAAQARAVLQNFGIDINDAANGVFLPASRISANSAGAAIHSMLHTNSYYVIVNQMLREATNATEAREILNEIGQTLKSGGF